MYVLTLAVNRTSAPILNYFCAIKNNSKADLYKRVETLI